LVTYIDTATDKNLRDVAEEVPSKWNDLSEDEKSGIKRHAEQIGLLLNN